MYKPPGKGLNPWVLPQCFTCQYQRWRLSPCILLDYILLHWHNLLLALLLGPPQRRQAGRWDRLSCDTMAAVSRCSGAELTRCGFSWRLLKLRPLFFFKCSFSMAGVETSEACACVYVELSKELRNCQQMVSLKIAPVSVGGCLRRERSLGASGRGSSCLQIRAKYGDNLRAVCTFFKLCF